MTAVMERPVDNIDDLIPYLDSIAFEWRMQGKPFTDDRIYREARARLKRDQTKLGPAHRDDVGREAGNLAQAWLNERARRGFRE